MAVKISQLSASTSVTLDDFFPIVDSGSMSTKRASAEQILNYITSSTFNSLTVTVLTGSNISGSLARFTSITGTHVGSGAGLTDIPNSALVNSSITVGSTAISLGASSTTIQGISVLTGSIITGSTALFNNLTASVALFNGDIKVLGTASITQLNTIGQQSLLIGDKYITILSGGVDHTGINGAGFLWGTSSGTGETTGALGEHAHILYDASRDALKIFPGLYVTGSTTLFEVSGTTAQFTTISSSNTNISGNLVLEGTANLSSYPDYAYIIYTASFDKLVVYPGLYVSGNLTGSGLGAFQTVSASTYLGLPTSPGGTPGGTNQTIQFNSGSTFSGSSNFVWDYTNNRLGIGTTSPSSQIEVYETSADSKIKITSDSASSRAYLQVANNNSKVWEFNCQGSSVGTTLFGLSRANKAELISNTPALIGTVTSDNITLGTNSTAAITIDTSQRVGIGTIPSSTLHVKEAGSSTGAWRGRIVAGGDNVAFLMGEYNSKAWLGAHNAALNAWSDFYINPDGTSSVFLGDSGGATNPILSIINSSGRVAIGKITANDKFDVSGNTIISGNLTVTGSVFVSGSSIFGQVAELTSSTSNYTLLRQDSGKFLHMSSSSAMNLTVPSGLPVGFTVSFCQNGSGQITVVASGVTIKNRQSHTKTAGDGAVASLICTGSNGFILTGDTAA